MESIANLLKVIVFIALVASCSKNDESNPEPIDFEWPPLHEGVSITQITSNGDNSWDFHCRWSNDGTKICFAHYNNTTQELSLKIWSEIVGSIETAVEGMGGDFSSSWSPDDSKIAFDARINDGYSHIYILDLVSGEVNQFTNGNSNFFRPAWSHNGESILFVNSGYLYSKPVSGGDAIRINGTEQGTNAIWSMDDTRLIFSKNNQDDDIHVINYDGTNLIHIATGNSSGSENWPSWSLDETKVVYQLFNGNIARIVMKDLATNEVFLLAENDDSRFPHWSPVNNSIVCSYNNNLWVLNLN